MPSNTNTGFAPNSRRHDVRKKRFLESELLLLENIYVGVSCIKYFLSQHCINYRVVQHLNMKNKTPNKL